MLALRIVSFAALLSFALPALAAPPERTASGIALDAPWKVTVYKLAREHFVHPAWGWQHSERNYRLALILARGDGMKVDADVLFAACFLHDMAAYPPYAKKGMEHGDRAAQTSVDVLRDAGFPAAKIPAVQAAERAHMYYRDPGKSPESIVLHDADSLDFLGAIGAARMLSLAGEKAPSFTPAVAALRSFLKDIPPALRTRTGRAMGRVRVAELKTFLDRLEAETDGGTLR